MILAGDIGGTKCNLALFGEQGVVLRPVFQRRYSTRDYAHLQFEDLIEDFIRQATGPGSGISEQEIIAAGFGSAGAVVDGRVQGINVPWALDARALARKLGLGDVVLLNDLAATALSLDSLASEDLLMLNQGVAQPGATKALIAAGTGLGEAFLFWDGQRHRAASSEGGQADFAPRTDQEIELLRFLKKRLAHVSCEEILSGRGFRRLHEFLNSAVRHPSFDAPEADPAAEITQHALARSCSVCVEALDLWTAAYGAEAGNFALRVLALGGVYVAGGIAPKILPKMKDGTFVRSFCDKAKLAPMLARIPIYVILNEDAPLWGVAYQALTTSRGYIDLEPATRSAASGTG